MRHALGTLLIFFGVSCLVFTAYLIWQRNTPTRLAFSLEQIKTESHSTSTERRPVTIFFPSLDRELPIIPTELNKGKWEATPEGVSYLISTPQPGETGNSILYGHNWTNLLGSLPRMKPGEHIEVHFSDGTARIFQIEFTSVVTPDQTHILNQTTDRRLTIYTCTGFLDTKRFVVTAILQE